MRDDPARSGRHPVAIIVLLVLVAALAVLAYGYRPWSEQSAAGVSLGMVDGEVAPEPGMLAPDFVLARADGSLVRLSDLRGRPVLLNFWADWCTFCKDEMPAMQRIADAYGDDLVVLGVNAGDPVEVGERFVEQAGVTYERAYDLDLEVTDGYRVLAMPTSYFIDADGIIIAHNFGVMTHETMLEKVDRVAGDLSP